MDEQPPTDPVDEVQPQRLTRPGGTARKLLLVTATIVIVEGLGLIGIGVAEVSSISSERIGIGLGGAAFWFVFGLLLIFAAVKVLAGNTWARGFLVFSQLLQLLISFNFRGDVWWIPTTLMVSAVVAIACLLAPPVTRALEDDYPV